MSMDKVYDTIMVALVDHEPQRTHDPEAYGAHFYCPAPECPWIGDDYYGHIAGVIASLPDVAVLAVPKPIELDGIPVKDRNKLTPEWWPDQDTDPISPWTVGVFDDNVRLDFDDTDPDTNFRTNTSLQISPDGEHWPFILLTPERAELMAGHLLAGARAARERTAQRTELAKD